MSQSRKTPEHKSLQQLYRQYGAEQGRADHDTEQTDRWYATVYDHPDQKGDRPALYRGASGYTDKVAAEVEAEAWCRDRGITAHPF